jgi:NAD(P)-dependent dehydrogenase (short-subunit alcohol dehydrogenase family)
LPDQPAREPVRLAAGAELWLTADDAALAERVEERLRRRGFRTRVVGWSALRGLDRPESLGGLVLLAPPERMDDARLKDAVQGARRVAPALRHAGRESGALFATVSRMDGAFGLGDLDPQREPTDGGLAGLAKTARWEWPEVQCKAIDLAGDFGNSDAAADALADELLRTGPIEVGLSRAGRRTPERVTRPAVVSGALPLAPGDVVVVSGGARGVTAEAAVALARACRPTLVLLGRGPAPEDEPDWLAGLTNETEIKRELGVRLNGDAALRVVGEHYRRVAAQREVRRTLERITAAGGRAVYHSADVRDAAAVAAVLRAARAEHGPVRGVVHGAGVLADSLIEDKTDEQFDRVYGTKVEGLRALLAAVDPQELRALVLFSSSTGRFGRTGQVDYAVANEALNKMAQQYARLWPRCRVAAINWGPWDGGMVTPGLKAVFTQEGVGLITPEAGAEYLLHELAAADRSVETVALSAGTRAPEPPPPAHPAPAPPAKALATAFERVLDPDDHPVLASHVLDGRPVLPLALTLEWLAHGALHQNPGLAFHGCDDLRVLRGVALDGPAPPPVRVVAGKAVRRDGLYLAPAELRGVRDGRETLYARADVVLAADLPPAPSPRPAAASAPFGMTPQEVYDRVLFHGPDLQCLETVEACDARGVTARLRPAPAPAEWVRRPQRQRWLADPLVLDGGFQMMVLWSVAKRGAPSLPCRVARYRQYARSFPADGARAVLEGVRDSDLLAVADLDFLDASGRLVARMEGCECAIDPALQRAFRKNRTARAALP